MPGSAEEDAQASCGQGFHRGAGGLEKGGLVGALREVKTAEGFVA